MSYHCPRCGFYWCQNQGGSLEEAIVWYREDIARDVPATAPMIDDPGDYPF